MLQDELIPVDWEGRALLQRVPVVDMGLTSDGALLKSAFGLVDALKASKVVMVRGHGSFARGESMEEVYMLTTSLEASSFYIYHLRGQDKAKSFS
jgi:L-fuculose-phosphate aldolase